jgi:hypothetical protein
MSWRARLEIDYALEQQRSVARYRHTGPLRVLQSLYPEGDGICHNVLVHPPGGLVGGDTLELAIRASGQTHGLLTTPGATRFYRSAGEPAVQQTHITLQDQARLEWLPLEAIAYNQCRAENRLTLELAPRAELLGWDVTALGLAPRQLAFCAGAFFAAHRATRCVAGTRTHRRSRPAFAAGPNRSGRAALHRLAVFKQRQPARPSTPRGWPGTGATMHRRQHPAAHGWGDMCQPPSDGTAGIGAHGGAGVHAVASGVGCLAGALLATAGKPAPDLVNLNTGGRSGH